MDIKLTKFLPNGESQPEQFLKKNTNTSKKTVNIHIQGRFPRNGLEKPHVFNKAIFCVVASYFLCSCQPFFMQQLDIFQLNVKLKLHRFINSLLHRLFVRCNFCELRQRKKMLKRSCQMWSRNESQTCKNLKIVPLFRMQFEVATLMTDSVKYYFNKTRLFQMEMFLEIKRCIHVKRYVQRLLHTNL